MRGKTILVLAALFLSLTSCKYLHIDGYSGSTLIWESGANNFFNTESPTMLGVVSEILITGETDGDQRVSLEKLPWHSVTLREVVKEGDSARFLGTFRYDGVALSDILSSVKIDKSSKGDFYPPVDLYVEVWNDAGEFAVFSWGEIIYSNDVYNIIIAKAATRVIPGKTGEKWDIPQSDKIVVGTDLFAERGISNPSKIVIKSLKGDFKVNREPEKFYSEILEIIKGKEVVASLSSIPENLPKLDRRTIYYGHGMGYKGLRTFSGVRIDGVLRGILPDGKENLRTGLVCIEAVDGYRASFSLSELINRVDGAEPLLMYGESGEKGRESFSVYADNDLFADRSIKGVNKITLY